MRLKRLELWWRRLWIRLLVRVMRRPVGGAPDWAARPVRVLFLRHDRAGDMILSTGVMRAIARSHPTITMDVLASPVNADILGGADYVNTVVVFDKRRLSSYLPTMRRLRGARYDAVVDCMVTAPSVTTLLLVAASGARQRVGIAGRGNDDAFTVTVPAESRPDAQMVDLLAALAAAFGVDPRSVDRRPSITLSDDERVRAEFGWSDAWDAVSSGRGPRVLVNVSAGTTARRWPPERYAAVMEHLHSLDRTVIFRVIAAPSEADLGQYVAERAGGRFVATPSIRDAFAFVATADFVFTPDTSIAHAASAFDTPCVALYLHGTAERWGLYDGVGASFEHSAATLDDLSVDAVLPAIDAVWNDRVVSRRA
jgi:ADP-heptose:LPS heptosyltransferase